LRSIRATRPRGRHVEAVVPRARRARRCRPWNFATTRLMMRSLRPRLLSFLREALSAWPEASRQGSVQVAGAPEAAEEEVAEAAAVAGAGEAAEVVEAAVAEAEVAAAAAEAAAAVAAVEAAAEAGPGRAHPLTRRRKRSRRRGRGRPSGCDAAECSSTL
jgi:hypothetical protein